MNQSLRSIIALRGTFSDFVSHYHKLLLEQDVLCLSDASYQTIKTTPFKQALNKLGQEIDVVVFDLTQALSVNALGAISGCIKGGGTLFLILPEQSNAREGSLFYQRLLKILAIHKVLIQDLAEQNVLLAVDTPSQKCPATKADAQYKATDDQQQTILAIKKVVTGHRNRPLVITSNRGRGKTSAIGMAINELMSERTIKVIVCAPTRAMVAPLFQFAGQPTDLSFVAPDQLAHDLPEAGLLIIDEAGAIPVPILSRLLKHYSRVVFSTTLHGYEGNGRGFAIRFYEQLNKQTPAWHAIELISPIRWGNNDPLESLINDLLLLDSEPAKLPSVNETLSDNLSYKKIPALTLLEDEELLRQVFGLLVIAHYQTRPSDLMHILDDKQVSIHAILYGEYVVATAIISHEGGLDKNLATAIYRGERRPKGHLVPQILLSQVGLKEASLLKTDRIMRIATHEFCRRKHIASLLLDEIALESSADYLSTSFGLSNDLLIFWRQANYTPVYLGLKREASSGYHSVVMLKALSKNSQTLKQAAKESFARNIVAQLGDALKEYNAKLAYQLLMSTNQSDTHLSQQEIRDINRFAYGQCGLDSALAALQRWLPRALVSNEQQINNNESSLLIMRILQHHSWAKCCETLGLAGKQMAQQTLQQTVSVLASQWPESDLSKDGLTRR